MNCNELDLLVQDQMKQHDFNPYIAHFEGIPDGQRLEVLNQSGRDTRYYQFLACLTQVLQPKVILELGGSIGTSAIVFCTHAPQAKVFSVDNGHDYQEGLKAWEGILYYYPNLIKVWGDDLDLSIYPEDFKLDEVDLVFLDTEHTGAQFKKELELYLPKLKKGCVVVCDDIRLNDMYEVWQQIDKDKLENTFPCHYSGFGFFIN